MGRLRRDYSLYRRRRKDGKRVWYYRTYDQYGERTAGRTTHETNRIKAERYCNLLLRTGDLVPIKEIVFEEYAKDWWVWGKCAYVRGRLARSPRNRPAISERHAADMLSALKMHILPRFRTTRLSTIRPTMIETWMFELEDKGLSYKRINNIAGCLRVMLSEAKRRGLLAANPFEQVQLFGDDSRDRGTFTIEEIRTLFAADSLEKIWNGHQLHRAVNELAAATGLRQGEILALRDEDVHADHVHVAHSWHWKYGLLPTKTRQERDVPVPGRVMNDMSFFVGSGGYVFSMNGGQTPASGSRITQALYDALERAGVPPEGRKRRNLTFHSWRHTFNSLARAHAVPTAILQRVTGHSTLQMTDHYTTFRLSDFQDVTRVQDEVFKDE